VADAIAELLKLVLACPGRVPAGGSSRRLDALFAELAADRPVRTPEQIEADIWTAWTDHDEPRAADRMDRAMACFGRKAFVVAEAELDALVAEQPAWAEAWNKRATLYFILGRHDESMADIARTLVLEPRHFGAICGFAQICLAQGRHVEALAALETALGVHPHLDSVRSAVDVLGKATGRRLN